MRRVDAFSADGQMVMAAAAVKARARTRRRATSAAPRRVIERMRHASRAIPAKNGAWIAEAAARYLVGGVNSPVRAFRRVGAEPVVVRESRGAVVRDVHGRAFIDLIMGWGALILGHGHPAVMRAASAQLSCGALFGLTSPLEVELARAIVEALPSIEQVRFTASGTEACMTAIRLARATTGRSKILAFEGCYHGHSDGLLVKRGSGLATLGLAGSAGVPGSIAQETIVVPYNDADAIEHALRQYASQIACAILEPIAANMGLVVPDLQVLHRVRELTAQHGIVLIFDEVVSGFRVTYGGAQTLWDIPPDLTVLGKIIGGGFPIGAVGGPARLMQRLAPEGDVYHAGTFAGHPVAMAAGVATLSELKRRLPYHRLDRLGARLAEGLTSSARAAGVDVRVNRLGSMVTAFFSRSPVTDFASAAAADGRRFAVFANALRRRGVLVPPSPFETMCVSTAHTEAMIECVGEAAADAYAQCATTDS